MENEHREDGDPEIQAFKARQREELRAFEERQNLAREEFVRDEKEALEEFERREGRPYVIKIDRADFEVRQHTMTGAELRALPQPPIGADRDLFLVVPGGSDKKIGDEEPVRIRDGLRFFTAPAQINPG